MRILTRLFLFFLLSFVYSTQGYAKKELHSDTILSYEQLVSVKKYNSNSPQKNNSPQDSLQYTLKQEAPKNTIRDTIEQTSLPPPATIRHEVQEMNDSLAIETKAATSHPDIPKKNIIDKTETDDSSLSSAFESPQYTIQICTTKSVIKDTFFNGNYGIRYIKTGELYRYIYSMYNTIEEAKEDLPKIKKIHTKAFIREIKNDKLGRAIDLEDIL